MSLRNPARALAARSVAAPLAASAAALLLLGGWCGCTSASKPAPQPPAAADAPKPASAPQTPSQAPADAALIAIGKAVHQSNGCARCHTIDGSDDTGPTWLHAYGTSRKLVGGAVVTVDDAYLRRAILDPKAEVAEGYEAIMPRYQGVLTDEQVAGAIAYIKSLAK